MRTVESFLTKTKCTGIWHAIALQDIGYNWLVSLGTYSNYLVNILKVTMQRYIKNI